MGGSNKPRPNWEKRLGAAGALFERYHYNAATGYHIWSSTLQNQGT